jgi:hypothetical protein
MMRNIVTTSIIVIALCGLAVPTGSVLINFDVVPDGDKAILNWESGLELNLTKYKLERSADNKTFTLIAEVLPAGNFSQYEYIDDDIMKSYSNRIYYYRIRMIFGDGTYAYSDTKTVILNFSGLQETWGSIKAMFR